MSLPPFTNVHVFGDSLVDPGNVLKLAKMVDDLPFGALPEKAPSAAQGYYEGRFSDGYTFADLISNKAVGVPTEPVFPFGFISYPFQSDPKGITLNFAYGGAQVRQGDEAVPDLDDQTDAFRDAVDGKAPPDGLYLFTIGANDVRDLVLDIGAITNAVAAQSKLVKAADELIEEVGQLIKIGARHVVVTGIPDIGVIPYYNGVDDEQVRREAATEYSKMLDGMIREKLPAIAATFPGVDLQYVSLVDATADVLQSLEQLYDPAALYPLSQSRLVFLDHVHPTAQAHALLAEAILDRISGTPQNDASPMKNADLNLGSMIVAKGAADRLTVLLAADTTYSFDMLGISSGKLPGLESWQVLADPAARILDPNGIVVADDDDGGLGLDAHLQFTTSSAGLYTLELSGVGSLTGAYTLKADNHGAHDDRYVVNDSAAIIIEGEGGGTDRVSASVSYALPPGAAIETLSTDDHLGKTAIDLTGNAFDQRLIGNAASNLLVGKEGNDTISGGAGDDSWLSGDAGSDVIHGNVGDDKLEGGGDSDILYGEEDDDTLNGGDGGDSLYGQDGDDLLDGGEGTDHLDGGAGSDSFYFGNPAPADIDTIRGFVTGTDKIAVSAAGFGLAAGALGGAGFEVGSQATAPGAEFFYNPASRILYWDSDGAGGSAPAALVSFPNGVDIAASDFIVI